MKLLLLSFSAVCLATILGLFILVSVPRATVQDVGSDFIVDANDALTHESLVLRCMDHFDEDGLAGVVTVLRIEKQGHGNVDSAWIHDFAKSYLANSCANANCEDAVVKATACTQLVSYSVVPF